MAKFGRRTLLQGSVGLAAASALPRAAIARGQTIKLWWNQGFYPAEDAAFRNLISGREKSTQNTVDLTFLPSQEINEKIVAALTSAAWQVGMYGFMAIAYFVIFRNGFDVRLEADTVAFWFMMQIAMLCGFATAYPVNWWLIRSGFKERM